MNMTFILSQHRCVGVTGCVSPFVYIKIAMVSGKHVASMGHSLRLQASIRDSKTSNPTSISLSKSLERSVNVCHKKSRTFRGVLHRFFSHPVNALSSSPTKVQHGQTRAGSGTSEGSRSVVLPPFRGLGEVAQVAWGSG